MIDREQGFVPSGEDEVIENLLDSSEDLHAEITIPLSQGENEILVDVPARQLLRRKLQLPSVSFPLESGIQDPFRIRTGEELRRAHEAEERRTKDEEDKRRKQKPSHVILANSRPDRSSTKQS